MDLDKTLDLVALQGRARERNEAVWQLVDWSGLASSLMGYEGVLNHTHLATIESYLAIVDAEMGTKEYILAEEAGAQFRELESERQIFDAKMDTERLKLAIKTETENYAHQVRLYEAAVKDLIMAAKEYAGEIEREQVAVEQARLELAIAKEENQVRQLDAEIILEQYKAAETQVDIEKAKLEVSRAAVRLVQAQVDMREAELKIVEAELEEAMSVAEAATLRADVASILAEIVTKGLTAIKLGVETAEIEMLQEVVPREATDELAIKQAETGILELSLAHLPRILELLAQLYGEELEYERDIRLLEGLELPRWIFDFEKNITEADLLDEHAKRMLAAQYRAMPAGARAQGEIAIARAHALVKQMMAAASASVKRQESQQTINATYTTSNLTTTERNETSDEQISSG